MDVTIENLERAVSQFYHTDSAMQAQAHQWLTEAQYSQEAWAFVWQLLHPNKSAEVQFFAATTLHNKILRNWIEVPADQYSQLKEKLLRSVIDYINGPKIVLNRLCISLSSFLIQTTPYFWKDSLNELMSLLSPNNFPNIPPERIIWILLEIFSVIPEEFDSMPLTQKHKSLVRNDLESSSSQVVNMVESVLGCAASSEMDVQAIKTAVSWLRFGIPLPSSLPLAVKIVEAVKKNPNESNETELEALYQMATHPDSHRYPSGVITLLETLLPLHYLVSSDNSGLVYNVYRVLVGLAESHTLLLLKTLSKEGSAHTVEHLMRVILACTAGPGDYPTDETHSQLTFGFWYIVQDELINLNPTELEAAKRIIVPAYKQASNILLVKSRYPQQQLPAQDAESFRCYRQDIADTMVYCFYIVREYLVNLLVESLNKAETWQEVEAVYHAVFALAETVVSDDDRTIVSLLATPHHLVNNRVLNTLNQCIGAYSEWLSGQGEALGQLVPRLVGSLDSIETATSATMALKDITRDCTISLKPLAEPLYTSCQQALSKGHLKQNECCRLMYSMGRLLSIMPYESMANNITHLLAENIASLQHILSQEDSNQKKNALLSRLKMLSQLLGTLYCEEVVKEGPAYIALSTMLPILATISQTCLSDFNIVQEVCNCMKNGVNSLLENCEPLLQMIVNITASTYSVQPNPSALELVKNIVLLFGGGKEEYHNLSLGLLHAVATCTMSLGERTSELSDVVQMFHNMMANIVKKKPELLISAVNIPQLFRFATDCLLFPEVAIVKGAGSFLCNVISTGRDVPQLLETVQSNGQHLVVTCLRVVGGEGPRNSLDVISEIILNLNKKFCDDLSRWMLSCMSMEDFPSPRVTQQMKTDFSKAIKEKANRRKLQEAIKEFSLICRGLVSADYTYQPPPL